MAEMVLATLRVADLRIGIDVSRVQEVLRGQDVEPVPRAPRGVAGLVNLRGQVIGAIDLRERLGLEPGHRAAVHYIVVDGHAVESLVVDADGDVVTIDPDTIGEVPDTTPAHIAALLSGAVQRDDGLLLLLDLDRALAVDDASDLS